MENLQEKFIGIVAQANFNVLELRKGWRKEIDVLRHYSKFYNDQKNNDVLKDICPTLEAFITLCVQEMQMRIQQSQQNANQNLRKS